MDFSKFPKSEGLYNSNLEKDSCGVGFVVNINGDRTNDVLSKAKQMLQRMDHRGACSCDNDTGDGSGVMTGIPIELFRAFASQRNMELPAKSRFAVGMLFVDPNKLEEIMQKFSTVVEECDLKVLFWKLADTDNSSIGRLAKETEPKIVQIVVVPKDENLEQRILKRQVFTLRKYGEKVMRESKYRFYICSLSLETIVYKGQFTTDQLWEYYIDLKDERFTTHLAIVHNRFSTNTFPSWERAHPQRMLAHNGEINTLRGNVNLMHAREGVMKNSEFGDSLKKLYPVIEPGMSDSGSLDNALEFIYHASRRSLPETVITMMPEAWHNDKRMSVEKRTYYAWGAYSLEPWDGPALITFSDGRYIGAILDRNGLRPSRYYITNEGMMYMSSEVGVVDISPEKVLKKGRLKAGRLLLVDTKKHEVTDDEELKKQICNLRPVKEWMNEMSITMNDIDEYVTLPEHVIDNSVNIIEDYDRKLSLFGYTNEHIYMLILPMINDKKEALGSMGNDTPFACLSSFNPLLFDYFKQLFAQVTNPPIDPFREKIVMSLACPIGPEANILEPSAKQCHRIWLEQPILSLYSLQLLQNINNYRGWTSYTIDVTYDFDPSISQTKAFNQALDDICHKAEKAVLEGNEILILTDRKVGLGRLAIPALLVVGAVHHHLIYKKLRLRCALIIDSGEAREVHHFCTLLGFGADAICPYMVFNIMKQLRSESIISEELTDKIIYKNFAEAVERGIFKVMAKMGISTLHSYKGAQIFEAVGLAQEVIDKCFVGTASRIGGVTFRGLAMENVSRYCYTYEVNSVDSIVLTNPGFYHWRQGGESHMNDPKTIAHLQKASKQNNYASYKEFVDSANESSKYCSLRGQMDFNFEECKPVDISEVEPAKEIVKRFVTGAMSFGSISYEAHTTLAIAMNRIGAKSNTGEGGELAERFLNTDKENNTRSAIKQVASARFGVTSAYLAHADELQIKMAQGAKPGEGGELPGHKVTKEIAHTRNSIPGVGLISPPPHHDIYSIEDLAQLIYDLKSSNPTARISVKLVSEIGVGVVAAGVVKGRAEHITISGHDGGTGASSWTGIKHAGLPWELGISETHQTLVLNDLRSRVCLQADGQIRTGRDVVIAALLGADEFGMSTAPLIVLGCTMMRKCHLNTCPVGIATQDPVLRAKFQGRPEYVINYLFMLAEEVRELMAQLGFRTITEMIGHTDVLMSAKNPSSSKSKLLDFSKILYNVSKVRPNVVCHGGVIAQDFKINDRIDFKIIEEAGKVIDGDESHVDISHQIFNYDRAFGSTLSFIISRKYGDNTLPPNKSINIFLKGSGGQSFCAFLVGGVKVRLEGDANDYVAKGLSGGKVVVVTPTTLHETFKSEENIIVGNVCLYGAVKGKAFFQGQAAERFCVRNSGAIAVVEGVGDHGCEYMTGGKVVILGKTGRNFAAGMSGGLAYILDLYDDFPIKCNMEMVDLDPVLPNSEDDEFLQQILKEFVDETGSNVAQMVLGSWSEYIRKFVKVFPKEYRKVLQEMKAGEQPVAQPVVKSPLKETQIIEDIEDLGLSSKPTDNNSLDKIRGFYKYDRYKKPYRPVEERINDWLEIYDHKAVRKGLKRQAARCMECGVPFCQSHHGCPLGNIIPKWNDLVFKDQWREALHYLLQTNNFPEFTGRCCPAPCEGACVLGINEPAVTIKNIECAIIDNAFEKGWMTPQLPEIRTGKKVVVVGSGPSGLAAAAQLNKAGHTVTVLERNNRIGGLLRYGIPTMKMDKDVVQRRVDLMSAEGIQFKTNVAVGSDEFPAKKLLDDFDAVLLCMGATWPRDLPIKGRDANGIHFAMSFLEKWQKHQNDDQNNDYLALCAKDKNVLVIGGGDTGVDCIGTSLRQGAKNITTFEILPAPPTSRAEDNPWPEWPKLWKQDYGHEEVKLRWNKDPRQFSIKSLEFLADEHNNVRGVKTIRVEWTRDVSAPGGWKCADVPNSEEEFQCELVLLAMGFMGPEKQVIEQLQLETDPRSNIKTVTGSGQHMRYRTSVPRVYAAGDCRRGQSLVVHAINEGRQAARDVDQDIMNQTCLAGPGGILNTEEAIRAIMAVRAS